ncbi:hypothetical protein DAEQUDRAFT_157119 [Daedalea quercina L-15889]|uniref:F-box domain-containing protein n=1 Tax=Daedalea quercina L-15889 TaxID=1314783 RepID=A0A165RQG1_9APHY|nr:hypothetical protein DAEQUDRAFT_157119 [Daedalea quercina L-15889]
MARLPLEVIEHVIDYVDDDAATLGAAALACHALVYASRLHRFRTVEIHSAVRATRLRDLPFAASGDLNLLVRTLKLTGYYAGSVSELLSSLPRLQNVRTLELSAFYLTSEISSDASLALKLCLPSLQQLHLRFCEVFVYHDLAALVSFFPSLATLAVESVNILQPAVPDNVRPPPPTLRALDLHLHHLHPWSGLQQARLFAWLLRHPVPQNVHTLKLDCSSVPGPLQDMLAAWGPVGLRHLELAVDWPALEGNPTAWRRSVLLVRVHEARDVDPPLCHLLGVLTREPSSIRDMRAAHAARFGGLDKHRSIRSHIGVARRASAIRRPECSGLDGAARSGLGRSGALALAVKVRRAGEVCPRRQRRQILILDIPPNYLPAVTRARRHRVGLKLRRFPGIRPRALLAAI